MMPSQEATAPTATGPYNVVLNDGVGGLHIWKGL